MRVQWVTARQVSNTSGGQLTTTSASKNANVTYTIRSVPEYYEPAPGTVTGTTINWQERLSD